MQTWCVADEYIAWRHTQWWVGPCRTCLVIDWVVQMDKRGRSSSHNIYKSIATLQLYRKSTSNHALIDIDIVDIDKIIICVLDHTNSVHRRELSMEDLSAFHVADLGSRMWKKHCLRAGSPECREGYWGAQPHTLSPAWKQATESRFLSCVSCLLA